MRSEEQVALAPAAVAEDIAVFRRNFLAVDISYSPSARAEAELRLKALAGAKLSAVGFGLEICRIVALADNGHSECRMPSEPRIPLQFTPIEGRYIVLGADPALIELLGADLMSVDGHAISAIADAGRKLRGGVPALREYSVAETLRTPERLHALGFAKSVDMATYRFRTLAGTTVDRRLATVRSLPAFSPLTPPDRAPWSQQESDRAFRWIDQPSLDAVIVQLRRNFDAPGERILDFLQNVEAERSRLGRRNVVLDMRNNSGGDLMLTRDFMAAWPAQLPPTGKIYVIEGPRTFSAGISSIGYLKQAGGSRVVLVGALPGDRLVFFAENKETRLPHSDITVTASRQRHDYREGCRSFTDCFPGVAQPGGPAAPTDGEFVHRPIAVKSLDPDVPVKTTVSDLLAGRDTAMEAIAALRRSSTP